MTAPPSVQVTTLVEVDPDTAFSIFTEDIDVWWRSGPRFRIHHEGPSRMRFEPRVGGRLMELEGESGEDGFLHGTVSVWDPPRRLVFEMSGRDFRPGDRTEVEVSFAPEGEATRVTVEHRGWERFPAGHPVRHGLEGSAFDDLMRVWWADLLLAVQRHAAERRS